MGARSGQSGGSSTKDKENTIHLLLLNVVLVPSRVPLASPIGHKVTLRLMSSWLPTLTFNSFQVTAVWDKIFHPVRKATFFVPGHMAFGHLHMNIHCFCLAYRAVWDLPLLFAATQTLYHLKACPQEVYLFLPVTDISMLNLYCSNLLIKSSCSTNTNASKMSVTSS